MPFWVKPSPGGIDCVCAPELKKRGEIWGAISGFSQDSGSPNPYTAELAAIAMALKNIPPGTLYRHVSVITRSLSALTAIQQPRQQSGQSIIRQIYESVELLKQGENFVDFIWIPAETDFALGSEAKAAAQSAIKQRRAPDFHPHHQASRQRSGWQ